MSIGTTIKRLRKEKDFTQEQLAEYLCVSPQAVSGWECDKNAPDISLLPILANIFDVTTDEILGVDISKKNDKISAYFAEADKLYEAWRLSEMVELIRRACTEFPSNLKLRYHLAWSLGQAQNIIRTRKENLDEAISIAEKILEESADMQMRLSTISLLSYLWHWNGDDKKALVYANELPNLTQSSGFLIGGLGLKKGEEGIKFAKSLIGAYYMALQENILNLCNCEIPESKELITIEDRIAMYKELLKLQSIVFGEELLCENFHAMQFCYSIAALYLELDKKSEALDYLEKSVQYAEEFERYDESSAYSSAIQNGIVTRKHNVWSQGAFEDIRSELCNEKFSHKYEKLKGHPRYERIMCIVASNTNK